MSKHALPEPISRLIDELSKLPGIGEKNATRLAFHIFRSSDGFAKSLSDAILKTKSDVITCSVCHNFTAQDPCRLCNNPNRDNSIICVVEEPLDLIAIEKSGEFKGKYHVLHGVISPLDGIGPEDLKIKELMDRLRNKKIEEIIIATNTNVEGEATSMYLAKIIKPMNIKTTRIAHGIPVGGDIEYIDELTLGKALKDRREI
ncbi:MAG: recombination protein RecR [Candidatus Dadabacteria bacterium]|nr:recombination protein RecR [Candidatus Dadabacteria bacterium]NIQ16672.1 recombination protein RecR [Candidatus Dadabacteria bacterium]